MSYKLFNVKNKKEWLENLMPSLRCLIIGKYFLPKIIETGDVIDIDFDKKQITYKYKIHNTMVMDYEGMILLDEDDKVLIPKTHFLYSLYNDLNTVTKEPKQWQP